jgi:hypothetical protein
MRFMRFVLARRYPDSGVEDGTFALAYELRDSPHVEVADRAVLIESLAWFEKNLTTPTRFNRTNLHGRPDAVCGEIPSLWSAILSATFDVRPE